MNSEFTVFIVDDDEAIRESLEILLTTTGYHPQVYANCEEFLAQYDPSRSGCLILDIMLPEMDGLELLSILSNRNYLIPTIILTGHADVPMAVEALTKGAINFIEKPYREHDLLVSVKKAVQKSQEDHSKINQKKTLEEKINSLSHRESQVLSLITEGLSDKQIAIRFGVTQRAISYHRQALLKHFDVSNTVRLATLLKVSMITC
jgi:FixJ family two-component response regulator